jgi:hypothetical protein
MEQFEHYLLIMPCNTATFGKELQHFQHQDLHTSSVGLHSCNEGISDTALLYIDEWGRLNASARYL